MLLAAADFHALLGNVWTAVLVVLFFEGTIFVHELGHFVVARRCGVKVERFAIGFGPAIWSRRGRDGVEYRLALIPFGGYVLLPQLADLGPSSGIALEGKSELDAAKLPPVPYGSKMLIFVAGAAFQIVFAFALACVIWVIGQPESSLFATTRIGYVVPTLEMPDGTKVPSPAAEAGLRSGDRVLAIDHQKVGDWNDLRDVLATSAGRDNEGQPRAVFTVERDGQPRDITLLPRLAGADKFRQVGIAPAFPLAVAEVDPGSLAAKAGVKVGDEILQLDGVTMLNDVPFADALVASRDRAVALLVRRDGRETALTIAARPALKPTDDFGLAFSAGMHLTHPSPFAQLREPVVMIFRTLGSLLNPHSDIGLSKLSGPVGIAHMLSSGAEAGLSAVLALTILLNVNLAVLNLFPIPVLDGGQMLFATIARLRGRALPINFIVTAQSVFFVLIISMFLYVTVFDVRRWHRDVQADHDSQVQVQK